MSKKRVEGLDDLELNLKALGKDGTNFVTRLKGSEADPTITPEELAKKQKELAKKTKEEVEREKLLSDLNTLATLCQSVPYSALVLRNGVLYVAQNEKPILLPGLLGSNVTFVSIDTKEITEKKLENHAVYKRLVKEGKISHIKMIRYTPKKQHPDTEAIKAAILDNSLADEFDETKINARKEPMNLGLAAFIAAKPITLNTQDPASCASCFASIKALNDNGYDIKVKISTPFNFPSGDYKISPIISDNNAILNSYLKHAQTSIIGLKNILNQPGAKRDAFIQYKVHNTENTDKLRKEAGELYDRIILPNATIQEKAKFKEFSTNFKKFTDKVQEVEKEIIVLQSKTQKLAQEQENAKEKIRDTINRVNQYEELNNASMKKLVQDYTSLTQNLKNREDALKINKKIVELLETREGLNDAISNPKADKRTKEMNKKEIKKINEKISSQLKDLRKKQLPPEYPIPESTEIPNLKKETLVEINKNHEENLSQLRKAKTIQKELIDNTIKQLTGDKIQNLEALNAESKKSEEMLKEVKQEYDQGNYTNIDQILNNLALLSLYNTSAMQHEEAPMIPSISNDTPPENISTKQTSTHIPQPSGVDPDRRKRILSELYNEYEFQGLLSPRPFVATNKVTLKEALSNSNNDNDNVILLNVNGISKNFEDKQNLHYVGLKIDRYTGTAYYIDPLGHPINEDIRNTIQDNYKLTVQEVFNQKVHMQASELVDHGHTKEVTGNSKDCGPFLVYCMQQLQPYSDPSTAIERLKGIVLKRFAYKEKEEFVNTSQDWGAEIRNEHLKQIEDINSQLQTSPVLPFANTTEKATSYEDTLRVLQSSSSPQIETSISDSNSLVAPAGATTPTITSQAGRPSAPLKATNRTFEEKKDSLTKEAPKQEINFYDEKKAMEGVKSLQQQQASNAMSGAVPKPAPKSKITNLPPSFGGKRPSTTPKPKNSSNDHRQIS